MVVDWLRDLPGEAFGRPSALPGWEVGGLVGHLILMMRGAATTLASATAERPIPLHRYVQGYAPASAAIASASVEVGAGRSGADLVEELSTATEALRAMVKSVAAGTTVSGSRGPLLVADFIATRIIEIVVHSDDLTRSLADRSPVPLQGSALGRTVRALAAILEGQWPGRSVEVRIPPYAAVQCAPTAETDGPGPRHTRGTPPNVIETDPVIFLRLGTGRLGWAEALATGRVAASGLRADLSAALPLLR